jgi:predicted acyltransferase
MSRSSADDISQGCAAGGRLLILLTSILLVVMPWTEYFWQFDHFLRGGQDLEFGLLALASIFCLVLVLSHQRKRLMASILVVRQWLFLLFHPETPTKPYNFCKLISSLTATAPHSPALGMYNLPIQV